MAASDFDCLVIGAGLAGSVVARRMAEHGKRVVIWERRNHIGGNMYDYVNDYGILVHKYGPHTFHTNDKSLFDFMCQFGDWMPYRLTCGAVIDGIETPTPFNFLTVDQFFPRDKANEIKSHIHSVFGDRDTVTVLEALKCQDKIAQKYAKWLFEKDYAPYTAKQWGISTEQIDPSVLERVPLRLSYDEGYFDDDYQAMPKISYTNFFEKLLDHPLIQVELEIEATAKLLIDNDGIRLVDGTHLSVPIIYTGALDELFGYIKGFLPYRSLRFEWKHEDRESFQSYPVVAYPQAEGFTRITEYKKLPPQEVCGTTYAVEYPQKYCANTGIEPYYPVPTESSQQQYAQYLALATRVPNLYPCGRLADFKYYNMDQALARALGVADLVINAQVVR
jgi:UDP-galactopyranose mutase